MSEQLSSSPGGDDIIWVARGVLLPELQAIAGINTVLVRRHGVAASGQRAAPCDGTQYKHDDEDTAIV